MLDLIDQVRTQPDMDPVLRVALLRKVLELALDGSAPLQDTLGGLQDTGGPGRRGYERALDGPREPRGRTDAAQGVGVPAFPARPLGRCARTPWHAGRRSRGCWRAARRPWAGWPASPRAGKSAPAESCRPPGCSASRSPARPATPNGKRSAPSIKAGRACRSPMIRRWPKADQSSSSPRTPARPGCSVTGRQELHGERLRVFPTGCEEIDSR